LGLLSRPLNLDAIDASNPLPIDLMEVTFKNAGGLEAKRNSASTVALGYPASVTKTARGFPRRLGAFCYATAAALVRPVPFDVEILQEDGSRKKTRLRCFIANNTCHVANFLVFPKASCRDGFSRCWSWMPAFLGKLSTMCLAYSDQVSFEIII
jgi:diacylglycerol kinase family enzyme